MAAQESDLAGACTGGGGEFAVGVCSMDGTVAGYCYYAGAAVTDMTGVAIAGATMKEYYYAAGAWTSPDAEAYCGLYPPGTWVP